MEINQKHHYNKGLCFQKYSSNVNSSDDDSFVSDHCTTNFYVSCGPRVQHPSSDTLSPLWLKLPNMIQLYWSGNRKWETFTLHHTRALMSVTIPSIYISVPAPSAPSKPDMWCLHTWLVHVGVALQQGSGPEKHWGCLKLFLFFFSSCLLRALCSVLLWPLMHRVHLESQSCETQDHRHGQKQFHPLNEPISTSHFERESRSLLQYTYNIQLTQFTICCSRYIHF